MIKFCLIFLFAFNVYAQMEPEETSEIIELSEDIVDISASADSKDAELQLEVSGLEDNVYESNQHPVQCGSTDPVVKSKEDPKLEEKSEIPKEYKEKGWKVLFEVKWMPIDHKGGFDASAPSTRFNERSRSYGQFFMDHNNTSGDAGLNFEDLREYANHAASNDSTVNYNQTMNSTLYNWLGTTTDAAQLDKRIEHISKNLSDDEFLNFLSSVGGALPYNDDRAAFKQVEGAGKGRMSPFEMITEQKSGVCGDIHTVVAKFAEKRGWEAFTIGYASRGGAGQHVVAAVVNPNKPGELNLVNYDQVEVNDLTDMNSIQFNPQEDGWEDVGIQYRIFKNDETGGDGKMQQIGTLPSALGDFFKSLLHKEYEIVRATPQNNNFRQTKAGASITSEREKTKKNGEKQVRNIADGLIIYEGATENAQQIYGIAVSHDVYKTIYKEDGSLKVNKYFSANMATSLINFQNPSAGTTFDELYVYLNIRGGRIMNLIESNKFKLGGIIGYELTGFVSFDDYGNGNQFSSADGNLEGFFQVVSEYNSGDHHAKVILKADTTVGLKNQNLMNNFSALPSNVNPLLVNAVGVEANYVYHPEHGLGVYANTDAAVSRLGNRVTIAAGLLTQSDFNVGLRYQGGMGSARLGSNNIQNINLFQNFGGADGIYTDIGGSTKLGKTQLQYNASVGVTTTTPRMMPIVQGGISLSLDGKRGKSRTPSSR